jgi:3-oxoacyl-[acyl-carrier protein] reductase
MDLGLKGKRAIVTAASRGLGLATARSLAQEGVNITMNARGAETLEAEAAKIREDTGARLCWTQQVRWIFL